MQKVLLVCASPRKKSNTMQVLEECAKEIERSFAHGKNLGFRLSNLINTVVSQVSTPFSDDTLTGQGKDGNEGKHTQEIFLHTVIIFFSGTELTLV